VWGYHGYADSTDYSAYYTDDPGYSAYYSNDTDYAADPDYATFTGNSTIQTRPCG
jgi:hypothetical protein